MKYKFVLFTIIIYVVLSANVFANILFSEIFPNTDDDVNLEYIELYNPSDSEESLSGFILKDKALKEYIFSASDILGAGEKKKYFRSETMVLLNNSDEELYLYDNSGNLVDSYNYSSSVKGEKIVIIEENLYEEPEIIIEEPDIFEEETATGVFEIEQEITGTGISEIEQETSTGVLENEQETSSGVLENEQEETNTGVFEIEQEITGTGISEIETETSSGVLENEQEETNTGVLEINLVSENTDIISYDLSAPEVVFTFQSPTYLYEKEKTLTTYTCDSTKELCKINLNLGNSFVGDFKETDFDCEINFGFYTGEENKCNPGTIIVPVGNFNFNFKIFSENSTCISSNFSAFDNTCLFSEKKFRVMNYGYTKPVTNNSTNPSTYVFKTSPPIVPENITEPEVKIQVSLDDENYASNENILGENFSLGIKIHKIMPNPDGSDDYEFIELINNSDKVFNLKGCNLDDKLEEGSNKYNFTEDEFLGISEIKRYSKEQTKLNLNNDSDEVNLICNNELLDVLKWDFLIKSGYYLDHSRLDIFSGKAKVIDVIDGDTIKIQFADSEKIETLRLIGVNTPETKHPNMEVEKYGIEVYEYVLSELKGKEILVELEAENLRDSYSRLLGFVYLNDISFNKKLIELGYSKAYLDYDFKYQTDYIEAEKVAKEAEIGIWSNEVSSLIISEEEFSSTGSIENSDDIEELKSQITIQGKVGSNKILNGNKITCYDTCSINFDGSESTGNIEKYSWDFGNGKTFDGVNPGYTKYEQLGNYKVYLATLSDNGELDVGVFFVNFIKTPKKQKVSVIKKVDAEDDSELENEEIILDEEVQSDGFNYSFYLYILVGIIGTILLFIILRREKLI